MANGGSGTRASDAERHKVIELLRHHTGAGRLTLDEFAERVGDVYASLTREELAQVVADLPEGVRPEVSPTAATVAEPAFPGQAQGRSAANKRRRFVAVMCSSEARGPWRAPEEMTAVAFWGGVTIDLRNALIESPVVEIRAWSIMGNVEVVVPPGIPVEVHGLVLMGGTTNRVRSADPIPGAPLVRIRARGLWGGVVIRNPSQRRQRHRRHQTHADVHRLVEDALDVARGAVDRALTTGSVADRIPRVRSEPGSDDAASPRTSREGASAGARPETVPDAKTTHTSSNSNASNDADASADGNVSARSTAASPRIPSGTLTIMVSDIAGSTAMTERYGDQDWIEILQAHNSIVRQRVAEHGGIEVKAQGDGFLVVFPSARGAVLAAIAVQRAMAEYRHDHPEVPIDVRLGLHTGEVVATDDDVLGHNVVVASRIASTASPGEIVVSGLTRDLTASASDLGFDSGADVTLKGVSQPWRVHRVLWS